MSAFPETSRIHQNIILTFHFTQEHAGAFYEEVFEQRSNEDRWRHGQILQDLEAPYP